MSNVNMRSLSLRGAENQAVPLSALPRGLENFCCENSMQRFSFACFRFCNAFMYGSVFGLRAFVFATRLCICSAVMYLVVFCVFAARLLNAAHE